LRSTGISPLPTRLSDWPKNFVGRGEEAAGHIEDALRLSPRDTAVYLWRTFKGSVKVFLAKNEEAVGELRRAIEANRNFSAAYFYLAVALAELGRLDEARLEAREGLSIDPIRFPDDGSERRRRADSSQGNAGDPNDRGGSRPLAFGRRAKALELQRPLPYDVLRIVASGEKEDGARVLV
jgi:tetratricopeptide (TPR) repeat protein